MKLPNLEKVKKMKPGGNNLPGPKRFHIKNRFLQKNLLSLIVVAVLAIGTGTAYGTLSSHAVDRGKDPVNGVNKDRYQVLVSGKGYKLTKKQEKDYKLQKKQNRINASNAAQHPNMLRSTGGSRMFRSGSHHFRYRGHSFKTSKNPRVSTNIQDQISMESEWKAGDTLKFRVSAAAYPYGKKNVISEDNIKINVEGGKSAVLYKSKGNYKYYSVELGEGKNTITISATDKKTKKTTKIGPYTIKAGAGNSGSGGSNTDPTQGTEDPVETDLNLPVTATADLSKFGLGSISFDGIIINKDTTAADVLKGISSISMSGQEISYISGDMDGFSLSNYSNSELQSIYKKECNVSGEIEESEYADWLDEVESVVKDSGKLGKGYPFSKTRWTYDSSRTGEDLASGITLTLILYDD